MEFFDSASLLTLSALPRVRRGIGVLAVLFALTTDAIGSGLTHTGQLAAAYDAILDADFQRVPALLAPVCGTGPGSAPPAVCHVMDVVSRWWELQGDPLNRQGDTEFERRVNAAINEAEAWTVAEPGTAQAWFYAGAAYSARVQWRVLRAQRLAAARDGKRIKDALEQAVALDPDMHDALFGIGMYRYYADVAPAAFRFLRWLLLLPGGDRVDGLRQMESARDRGRVVRGEAEYQLHLIYLWYEHRVSDALALVRGLEARYPRNPLFVLIDADIHDVYLHDVTTSERILRTLITRAESRGVNHPALATRLAERAIAALHARAKR